MVLVSNRNIEPRSEVRTAEKRVGLMMPMLWEEQANPPETLSSSHHPEVVLNRKVEIGGEMPIGGG